MIRPNLGGWEYELDIERKSGSPMIDYVFHKKYDSLSMASFAAGLFVGQMMLAANKNHRKFHVKTLKSGLVFIPIQYELILEFADESGQDEFLISIYEHEAGSSDFDEIDQKEECLLWV